MQKKWENILRLQQSRCMIPWSHDTGVDNQHSCHAITWPHREKQKWTKAPPDKSPKGSESRETNPPKMRKYFKTPTIKVYDPMITWYICGQSTFSSCYHVAAQKKAKMDKSTTGRKPQKIRIKADKSPKNEKIFYDSNNQGVQSHNHMIQVWTINILVMPSRGRTEKSKNGQKHHRTKAPKDQNKGGQNPPKMRKYFMTPTNKVYDPIITWYRSGQSTLSSCNHVAAQRKSKNGQKHHRTKAPKDQNQGGQNPQKWENILWLQQSRCTIPWSHETGVDNQHSRQAIMWPHRVKHKWTKAPQDESPKGSESRRTKPSKNEKIF